MTYGIDYGNGKVNIDKETGIRFGVISIHEVTQAWCDDAEPVYPEIEVDENDPEYDSIYNHLEAIGWRYTDNEYRCFQGSDDSDLFVEKSPYFTYAKFCSPCAPGAVHLKNHIDVESAYPGGAHDKHGVPLENNRGYCLGHDWFTDVKAPYPVYSVKTGEVVP